MRIDPLTGTPRVVAKLDGFLTGASSASSESVARGYLTGHRDVFRVTAWTLAAQGTFTAANRYILNLVPATTGITNVRSVRFTMISPQVPGGTAASCPGPFDGCTYMGMTGLVVHGTPSP